MNDADAATSPMSFLDPTVLAQIGNMPLRAKIVVEGALTGMHRARLRGSSVEFAEHKEYSPGDEIRHIDWKAYAKVDRYYVKQFEQESQLTAYLVVDASTSMNYAGLHPARGPHAGRGPEHPEAPRPSKLAYAAYLMAALSYIFVRQRDRVGLLAFGAAGTERYLPPRARPAHLSDLFTALEDLSTAGGQGSEMPAEALARIADLAGQRRSLILIASDFLSGGSEAIAALGRLRARGHEVAAFHLLDPDELDFPFRGLTRFEALEDSRTLLASPEAIRRTYLQRLRTFLSDMAQRCLDSGVGYQLIRTSAPVEQTLVDFLGTRGRSPRGAGSGARTSPWSS